MKLPVSPLTLFILAVCAGVAGYTALEGPKSEDGDAGVTPVVRNHAGDERAPLVAAPTGLALRLEQLQHRVTGADDVSDVFGATSMKPPPPPPPPPSAPHAPPFSYRVMGSMRDESTVDIFLTANDRVFVVRSGDVLDHTYRVDSIDAHRMVVTYLPLKEQQTIALDR